jgi:actin-related protein
MDNSPWDATIFFDGEWKNVCPSNVEIFECLKRIQSGDKNYNNVKYIHEEDEEYEDKEDEDKEDEEEDLEWEFTEEEEEVQEQMRKYMESELDKSDLESMTKMDKTEQVIYVLNKCILNISSEKYKSNRELFYKFINIILKFTEKDIAATTGEMEKSDG